METFGSMTQLNRLLIFFVIFLGPWAATAYVVSFGLKEATLDGLLTVALIAVVSFVTTILGTLAFIRIVKAEARSIVTRAGSANLLLCLLDLGIFSALVYDRYWSLHKCTYGPTCELFPAGWLALAAMHFCYAGASYLIKFKTSF